MEMPHIVGTLVGARDFPKYTWNADLVAFDGPLISLYKRESGRDALFVWLDCDDRKHRWCVAEVERELLRDYLTREASLLDVLKDAPVFYVFHTSAGARKSRIIASRFSNLPPEYFPDPDSYLEPEIATAEAVQLIAEMPARYDIKLDGELYLDDLSGIPRLYQQLYSFHYGIEHLHRAAVRDTLSGVVKNWNGGFSAVNLFTGLRNVTPSIHRARVKSLEYNSPGHITMELLPAMAKKIYAVAKKLDEVKARKRADELYTDIYRYFRDQKISGFEDERGLIQKNLTPLQTESLGDFVRQLINLFDWGEYERSFTSLDVGPLPQLRALLAYYRRLRRLLEYSGRGLIRLPAVSN